MTSSEYKRYWTISSSVLGDESQYWSNTRVLLGLVKSKNSIQYSSYAKYNNDLGFRLVKKGTFNECKAAIESYFIKQDILSRPWIEKLTGGGEEDFI